LSQRGNRLPELREPSQLPGLVVAGSPVFSSGKQLRRQGQRAGFTPPNRLTPSMNRRQPIPSPATQAVTREEEAILWRALERIPDTYREPLILFYREQQSVERVAAELELSEDAVKQRLSRGRSCCTKKSSHLSREP